MKTNTRLFLIFTLILAFCAISAEAKGNKYALFIGINNYPDTIGSLSGCENDSKQMKKTLTTKYGFKPADTTMLLSASATRQAIIDNLKLYAAKASAGDIFVMQYSGHGSLFPDAYSEEMDETRDIFFDDPGSDFIDYPRDKYDSTILPVDAMETTSGKPWMNMILDDELFAMFSEFTKKGVQVVFISDSCFSGDISRAKVTKEKMRAVSVTRVFGAKSFEAIKFAKPATTRTVTNPRPMNNLYITMTGADADELASDGAPKKLQMGLFTENLVKSLNAKGAVAMTYSKLMTKVSAVVKTASGGGDRDQNPQLEKRFGDPNMLIFSFPK